MDIASRLVNDARRVIALLSVLTALVVASPSQGQQAVIVKSPWLLSDDDRIRARIADDLAKTRQKHKEADDANGTANRVASNSVSNNRWVDVIDGRRHPELFLPTELFHQLIQLGYIVDDPWQDAWQEGVAASGLPASFWQRLETLTEPYIADLKRERQFAHDVTVTETQRSARARSMRRMLCREAFAALNAARGEFGEAIDRFMYQYIAPQRVDYKTSTESEAELKYEARGCK